MINRINTKVGSLPLSMGSRRFQLPQEAAYPVDVCRQVAAMVAAGTTFPAEALQPQGPLNEAIFQLE